MNIKLTPHCAISLFKSIIVFLAQGMICTVEKRMTTTITFPLCKKHHIDNYLLQKQNLTQVTASLLQGCVGLRSIVACLRHAMGN